ncbi:YdcF family protein [Zooshikella sp. RANM57]|uniref:YdcF family protein n=1 Tax=Zooshikella sp. RANM57 TaxID=3425863 RepID=UPI003D6F436A
MTMIIIWLSLISLYLLCTPVVSSYLMSLLESEYTVYTPGGDKPEAMVILGAGRHRKAQEFDGKDIPSAFELERMTYAAYLNKQLSLPILVTGGKLLGSDQPPEAKIMTDFLQDNYGIKVRWQEGQSRNTWENAFYTQQMLTKENIHTIVLVTHAWHMRRAVASFKKVGLNVLPAPTRFISGRSKDVMWYHWLPTPKSFTHATYALHEIVGLLWYRWKYF